MNVFYCNDFDGHWPVGTAAVIVADSPEDAAKQLERRLEAIGLTQVVRAKQMKPVDTGAPVCIVIRDGDY
jgi:hypothetical protein